MGVFAYMYVDAMLEEVRRYWIFWSWSYRQFLASGNRPRSSAGAAGAVNHWAISSVVLLAF